MSFQRRVLRSFIMRRLWKTSTLAVRHRLLKNLYTLMFWLIFPINLYEGSQKKDGGHLKNIKVYYETHSLDGNPHLTFRVLCVSNCKPEGESSSLPAPLCRLTAQCDFYCPVFGVPAREVSKASRVTKSISVSTGPISAWPHKAAHWAFMVDTMSLLFRGLKRDGGGVEPWGHPGRPPLNSTRAMWQQGTMSMHYVNNILQHPLFTSAIERCVPFVPTTNIVGSSGAI